jgi:hypothetical protein
MLRTHKLQEIEVPEDLAEFSFSRIKATLKEFKTF